MTLAKLAWRNVLRNKVRLFLTVTGVAVAVMTFVTLRTAVASWDRADEVIQRDRLVTRQTFAGDSASEAPMQELRDAKDASGAPLVRAVSFQSWFGGRVPERERDFFATMAADPDSFFEVFDEIVLSPEEIAAWKSDRNGAIVGDVLARHMNWHVGDRVSRRARSSRRPTTRRGRSRFAASTRRPERHSGKYFLLSLAAPRANARTAHAPAGQDHHFRDVASRKNRRDRGRDRSHVRAARSANSRKTSVPTARRSRECFQPCSTSSRFFRSWSF